MKFEITRQKLMEIILTALLSALIAIFQNLLLGFTAHTNTGEVTLTASLIGACIRSCRA